MWVRGEGDSPPRNMRRGGSLRVLFLVPLFRNQSVLGHLRRALPGAADSEARCELWELAPASLARKGADVMRVNRDRA